VLLTLVVRLRREQLAAGEFVGEVESVGDGERALVRDIGDLTGFARQAAAADAQQGEQGVASDDNGR
jgi:hypothetical protein